MIKLLIVAVSLATACSRDEHAGQTLNPSTSGSSRSLPAISQSAVALAPPATSPTTALSSTVTAPLSSGRSVTTSGDASGLRLKANTLSYCDGRGSRALDLLSGAETRGQGSCPNEPEVRNITCDGIEYVTSVRAPEHDDIIDTLGSSIPMKGRLKDCAFDSGVLLVATWDEVMAVDVKSELQHNLAKAGGNQVAINTSWMAWSDGKKVFAQHR